MTQQSLISDLPDWVPTEAWAEFIKMRKTIKKPLTEYAARLVLKKLGQMVQAGQDAQEVLDQSILNGWQGIFEARGAKPVNVPHQQFQTPTEKARGWAEGITGRARSGGEVINMAPVRRLR